MHMTYVSPENYGTLPLPESRFPQPASRFPHSEIFRTLLFPENYWIFCVPMDGRNFYTINVIIPYNFVTLNDISIIYFEI